MAETLLPRFMDLLHAATNPRSEAMLVHGYDITRDDFALRYCCEDKVVGGRLSASDIRRACEGEDDRLIRTWAETWAAAEAEPDVMAKSKEKWKEAVDAGVLMHEYRAAS